LITELEKQVARGVVLEQFFWMRPLVWWQKNFETRKGAPCVNFR